MENLDIPNEIRSFSISKNRKNNMIREVWFNFRKTKLIFKSTRLFSAIPSFSRRITRFFSKKTTFFHVL